MVHVFSALRAGRGASNADAVRRRNLIAVSVAAFLASVGFMVVMPLLPGLIREVIGGDGSQVGLWLGLAISVSPFLTALTGPFWAALGERFGRKAMIERSIVCIGIGIGLMAVAQSPIHVVALRAVIGGLGGVSVAALAAVTATTPRRELGPAVGTLQAAQTAGSMVGPLIGGILGGLLGMREAFIVSGAVFVAALILVHWLYVDTGTQPAEPSARTARSEERTGGAFGLGMVVALLAAFAAQFVEGSLIVLLPIQVEQLGAAPESLPWVIGIGLSATYLAATLAAAVGGRLAGRRSAISLLIGVLALGLVALIPLALAQTWWQCLGFRALLALAVGAGPTLAYSAAAALAPPEQRAKMVGLVSSAGISGWAASPLAAGALIQVSPLLLLGLDAALYALVIAALLGLRYGLFDRLSWLRLGGLDLPTLLPNVAGPREILGWLPSPASIVPHRRQERFSVDEVIAALRGTATGPRADVILETVARPAEWMPADPERAFRNLPRHADRLPTILHLYRQGEDTETIGRRLSPLGGGWAVERTVEITAGLIADRLNR